MGNTCYKCPYCRKKSATIRHDYFDAENFAFQWVCVEPSCCANGPRRDTEAEAIAILKKSTKPKRRSKKKSGDPKKADIGYGF